MALNSCPRSPEQAASRGERGPHPRSCQGRKIHPGRGLEAGRHFPARSTVHPCIGINAFSKGVLGTKSSYNGHFAPPAGAERSHSGTVANTIKMQELPADNFPECLIPLATHDGHEPAA